VTLTPGDEFEILTSLVSKVIRKNWKDGVWGKLQVDPDFSKSEGGPICFNAWTRQRALRKKRKKRQASFGEVKRKMKKPKARILPPHQARVQKNLGDRTFWP